ncbi:MAG: class I SAM-dependent methyltransferase [Thermomicrobiales bacterium]
MKLDQIQRTYDRRAPRYDAASDVVDRFVTRELRAAFGAQMQGRVLEVAIGTGRNLPFYAPAVSHVVGVDLSAGMLREARRRIGVLDMPVDLLQMNAERLAFPDHTFDVVAVSEAFCTIPRPEVALAELRRVCRPGGTAVFLEHVRSSHAVVYQLQRLVSPLSERNMGCSWTRDTPSAIREAGFHIRSERTRLIDVFHLIVASCSE